MSHKRQQNTCNRQYNNLKLVVVVVVVHTHARSLARSLAHILAKNDSTVFKGGTIMYNFSLLLKICCHVMLHSRVSFSLYFMHIYIQVVLFHQKKTCKWNKSDRPNKKHTEKLKVLHQLQQDNPEKVVQDLDTICVCTEDRFKIGKGYVIYLSFFAAR